jgi:predicted O-methyltransferase YrrM
MGSNRGRQVTFEKVLGMMEDMRLMMNDSQSLTIVETGTIRYDVPPPYPDGHSARLFGKFVAEKGGNFYSIDNDKEAVKVCQRIMDREYPEAKNIHIVHSDSLKFLENFGWPIDVLYLDSANDAKLILNEAKTAISNLHRNSIILIDDVTAHHSGMALRKGELVIPYLEKQGWISVITLYQALYVRENSDWATNGL